jgi:hypothetical protein
MRQINSHELLFLNAELDAAGVRAVQRRVQSGQLIRIHPAVAISASLPESAWPILILKEKIRIMAALFPGAVIGYRSAFDAMAGSTMYLNSSYSREVALPGLTVKLVRGLGPLEGDHPLMGKDLYFSSQKRMVLDAFAPAEPGANSNNDYPRKISASELETRLIEICEARGEKEFLLLRDRIKALAPKMKRDHYIPSIDKLFGGILGTRPAAIMATSAGKGRALGYDANRVELFLDLAMRLKTISLPIEPEVALSPLAKRNFAFLESYFSNFIEGTEFEIEEARAIALEGKIDGLRPKDSHDIKGVFEQAYNPLMRARRAGVNGFEQELRERHALMMAQRPEVGPGDFKITANVAGNTTFVEPRLVRGTLTQAEAIIVDVMPGLPRALMTMFVISEIHPFADGNGRMARLFMNAELSAQQECRIIIPTLYRMQYLDCLRALTREKQIEPYLKAMTHIQKWSSAFDYEDLNAVIEQMQLCNAFEQSINQHKLLMPMMPARDEGVDAPFEIPRG